MILLDSTVQDYAINRTAHQHADSRSMPRSRADGRALGVVVPWGAVPGIRALQPSDALAAYGKG